MLDNFIEKLASSVGKGIPRVEKPTTNLDNPNSNEYHTNLYYEYCAHNIKPYPIVMKEGKGAWLWDVTGKKYLDFMAGHSSVNQGHCHPKLVEAITEQAKKLTMVSHITLNDQLGPTSKYLSETFGYDKILLMNTGADAVETAVLMARKWGYEKKQIPSGQAQILFPTGNYWGKTIGPRAGSDTDSIRKGFEPLDGMNFDIVAYNDVLALENKFKSNPNIAAFVVEPIQGTAGIVYPADGYLKHVKDLCDQYNVLLIVDEVFMGLGRTGKLFCFQWDNIKPDIVTLGKSLSGGFYPVSAVLANNEIMDVLKPSDMDSTYCANPMAVHLARTAVQTLLEEGMIENSYKLGLIAKEELMKLKDKYSFIKEVRAGKGLAIGIEMDTKLNVWTITKMLLEEGLLCKPGKRNTLKIHPPIMISEEDFRYGLSILAKTFESFDKTGKLNLFTSKA